MPFSVVCFRLRGDASRRRSTQRLLDAVNASGEVFLSHTKLDGRYVLRLAIGNLQTTERHVARAWELLNSHAALSSRSNHSGHIACSRFAQTIYEENLDVCA